MPRGETRNPSSWSFESFATGSTQQYTYREQCKKAPSNAAQDSPETRRFCKTKRHQELRIQSFTCKSVTKIQSHNSS